MLPLNTANSSYLNSSTTVLTHSVNQNNKSSQSDVLELVTDGYLLLDERHDVTYASNKVELWIGIPANALFGEYAWSFLPEDVVCQLLGQLDEFGQAAPVAEARWLHPSFQTYLKLRLVRHGDGWLLSFFEESSGLSSWQTHISVASEVVNRFKLPDNWSNTRTTDRAAAQKEILAAAEAERCHIARELHDVLGQYVTALRFGLDNLANELEAVRAETSSVMKLQSMVAQFDQEFHHVALKLRPPMTERGLKAAVMQYALEWSERSGVRLDFHSSEDQWGGLSPETETSLYRVLQEALNNVQKYARARRVSVILERRHGQLQMVIEDDGCGFDLAQACFATGKIGLASMSERAALAGGCCEIESSPGQGTTIFIRVPLSLEEELH